MNCLRSLLALRKSLFSRRSHHSQSQIDSACSRRLHCGSGSPLIALAASAFFSVCAPAVAHAQAWPAPNPYVQPAPYPQPGYAAPAQGYAPPAYSQQPYAQQPYTQQPQDQYPQQDYGQQAYAPPTQAYPPDNYSPQQPPAQPLDPVRLEQLVAPIALYPDTMVAQILAAATYPAQVAAADHWRQAMGYAPPDAIAAGANAQPWDPSVKALTAFPQILAMLDQNLQWTTDLGNAYFNQPQDVLETVQVLRQRAQAAGTLESSPQEAVNYDQGYIELAPVNPAVVYVPAYDPWTAYGQPIAPYSGFSFFGALGSVASFAGSALMRFGPGIAMGAFSHTPFGLLSWAINWLGQAILFNHSAYYSHSTTVAHWNLPPRTPRGFPERAAMGVPGERYNRFPQGSAWANRGSPAQQFAREPERDPVRPAFQNYRPAAPPAARPQPYAPRVQDNYAYNRQPEPIHQNYGSGYMSRPAQTYSYRPGYSGPAPEYRAQAIAPQRGYSQMATNRGFNEQQFKPEKSGGFHLFGEGNKSEFGGGKMPKEYRPEKMPKSFGHEKMPKAPKEHGHSGGGHGFGGHHH
jgi:hypothetical protein